MRIRWKKRAKAEYQKHIVYCLRKFGPYTASRFQEKTDKHLCLLENFPHMGKLEPLLLERRRYEYRSLVVHKRLKLVYYIKDDIIYIANLWDTRQEPHQLAEETDR